MRQWSIFCPLIATVLLFCGVSGAWAQETPSPIATVVPPLEVAVVDLPPVVEGTVEVAPSLADSGYWFVSTDHSPQSFHHSCPRFCPCVLRYEECVGFRRSSIVELCAGLEPGVPVCIMVHGSFVDTASAKRESACTWKWLRRGSMGHKMQMIYLSWPSYSPLGPLVQLEVNKLGRQAGRNGYYLAELTQHVPPECPICLLGHSHGTRVISSALHLLAGGTVQGVRHPFARAEGRHIRTVFTASAIDHDWLNPTGRYGRALCSTQCLLNLKNMRDPALRFYACRLPLISKRPLGQTGLTSRDRHHLGGWGRRVNDYDVTGIIGAAHLWPYYFTKPSLACVLHNYVYFPDRTTPLQASLN
ncbi:MAG: hypothetical protein GY878_02995 [Fuerstiella sp.]|nr:hypothetical protein [Fuerstiella sp.]